jgi:hypothetical protein
MPACARHEDYQHDVFRLRDAGFSDIADMRANSPFRSAAGNL